MRIPWVTENTIDLASDINESLRIADGIIPSRVKGMATHPSEPHVDGDRWAVSAGATGAFAGHDGGLAIYVERGNFWQFHKSVLCVFNNALYVSTGADWVAA